jgi:tRNA nucleotidyltransferase (CCA-adding enzyme)
VHVVARSRAAFIDVAQALRAIGGGGHPSAASGVAKHGDAAQVQCSLLSALRADPPTARCVADLMSSPPQTSSPALPLSDLPALLVRHHGLPVVERGNVVGIVSRRDLRRAEREQLMHRVVSTIMTRNVITTAWETPIEDAIRLMSQHDVGRLPVMRDGLLVGVIARSDLLGAMYGVPAAHASSREP